MIQDGDIVVVTGIMAAGKSTVAQALAQRLPRSVHLRGDTFRRFIVNGQAPVTPEHWTEAEQQLHLRYQLATDAAITYAGAGFAVVYQDVILGSEVPHVLALLRRSPGRIFLVVLVPAPGVAAERDRLRAKTGYTGWTPHELDEGLRAETPHIGFWLDNSTLSVEQTVDTIFAQIDMADVTSNEIHPATP